MKEITQKGLQLLHSRDGDCEWYDLKLKSDWREKLHDAMQSCCTATQKSGPCSICSAFFSYMQYLSLTTGNILISCKNEH